MTDELIDERGPYTCCRCTQPTWNDDDWCDACVAEAAKENDRPALSPPAEGVCVPGWPAGMTRGAIDDVTSGRGLPPLALPMPPYHYQQTDLTGGSAVSSPTPTPIRVDWTVVGPKLVEAGADLIAAINFTEDEHGRRSYSIRPSAFPSAFHHLRAALAATQPQSNGE